MSWKLPPLETDEAARRFLESTGLTDHLDRATRAPLTRELEAKDKALTPRPSKAPLADTCSLRSGDVITGYGKFAHLRAEIKTSARHATSTRPAR